MTAPEAPLASGPPPAPWLLDAGPAWVGTRVPWSEVRGARVRDDGVALVLAWSEVLVRLPAEEVDPVLQWLGGRGVRRVDDDS